MLFDTRRANKSSANLLSGWRSGERRNEPPNITSVPEARVARFKYWTSVKWYPLFFPQYLLHHFVVLLNKGGKKKKKTVASQCHARITKEKCPN